MTESIGILDQAEGVNVACFDASEDDAIKTEPRIIQQVDLVQAKKITIDYDTPHRIVYFGESAEIHFPLQTPHNDPVITVGDNSLLEINCRMDSYTVGGGATVTPIVLSAAGEPMFCLPTKAFCGIHPTGLSNAIYYHKDTLYCVPCPPATWWVGQYHKLAFVCSNIAPAAEAHFWFNVHSGFPNDNYDMFQANQDTTIGGATHALPVIAASDTFASS